MFAPTLWRNVDNRSFKHFQQGLLHTFSAHITGYGRVVTFTCNLVDLIDKDNPAFSRSNIVVGYLEQPSKNAFHIFTDVSGFGKRRRIGDAERNMQHFGDSPGEQGFAGTGFTDDHNV